ncbi:MAG: hypothetical protein ACRCYQ_12145 [Nocardioides sp.]
MDDSLAWQPRRERPTVVWPQALDPRGITGPTRGQARARAWRRCARGWYVPVTTDSTSTEQRVLEQAVTLTGYGAVSGWASLRWRGARYFDGREYGDTLPVPIVRASGGNFAGRSAVSISREQLPPEEIEVVGGIKCTTPARALFDEMRRVGSMREAVVALDMTLAAKLITLEEFAAYVARRSAWAGVPRVRDALSFGCEHSRSPQETRMRLVWIVDAGFAMPLVNHPVFDLAGNLLGVPDLLDLSSGVVGEYDGIDHKDAERHRRDVAREERYREHGLEYFTIVGGDLRNRALCVSRMCAAQRRARQRPVPERRWTLETPLWWSSRHDL